MKNLYQFYLIDKEIKKTFSKFTTKENINIAHTNKKYFLLQTTIHKVFTYSYIQLHTYSLHIVFITFTYSFYCIETMF